MWTFDNFPSAAVKQKYGITIDQKWLDHVRAGAVRLAGGCSASVVSADGLVLTNHHCVAGCVQDLSSKERDYIKTGFSTASRSEERQCPGMQAEILASIGDVTPTVNEATKGKSGPDYVRARDAVVASIEKQACQGHETVNRCQVISLYDGGQYKLYTYRKYSDVRLVFAVEFATAFFGGDPDNFNFPRYDLDFSFLRLYENGAPVSTPEHLRWNSSAPKDGDPVFVAGNPGGTDRQLTAAQLLTMRDVIRPPLLMQLSELRGRYSRFAEESVEHARIVTRSLFGIENTLKALRGAQLALLEPQPVERDLEDVQLEFWLTKLREELTADAPETALYLGKDSPENLARTLTESRLGDAAFRKQLWEGGAKAIAASTDSMIRFVLKTDAAARAIRKQYEERVDGPTHRASERIAQARFAVSGTSLYPAATFSLRLSYGKIAGWTYRGRAIPSFTTYDGLYQRATGQFPFALAPRWTEGKGKLDLKTVFDISSENDIIGGNSGSPLINAKGEVIGAIFDGNIHSLGGDFYYDGTLNRAVSVSTTAITEALNKIYNQPALIAELNK